MPRIRVDELEYCIERKKCYDCHVLESDKPASQSQRRRTLDVPCCRKHFNEYKAKLSNADREKCARAAMQKRQLRQCVYKGCHRKLIPQELLPPWIQESTCGMHVGFKAFRINRAAILKLIVMHCLSPQERKGMIVQNIVYRRGDSLVWFSWSNGRVETTVCFTAQSLLDLHRRCDQQAVPNC